MSGLEAEGEQEQEESGAGGGKKLTLERQAEQRGEERSAAAAPCCCPSSLQQPALDSHSPAKMEREREQLAAIIQEWNMNRLDLFELSQPNEVSSPLSDSRIRCPVQAVGTTVPSSRSKHPPVKTTLSQQQQQLLISKTSRDKCVCCAPCTSRKMAYSCFLTTPAPRSLDPGPRETRMRRRRRRGRSPSSVFSAHRLLHHHEIERQRKRENIYYV